MFCFTAGILFFVTVIAHKIFSNTCYTDSWMLGLWAGFVFKMIAVRMRVTFLQNLNCSLEHQIVLDISTRLASRQTSSLHSAMKQVQYLLWQCQQQCKNSLRGLPGEEGNSIGTFSSCSEVLWGIRTLCSRWKYIFVENKLPCIVKCGVSRWDPLPGSLHWSLGRCWFGLSSSAYAEDHVGFGGAMLSHGMSACWGVWLPMLSIWQMLEFNSPLQASTLCLSFTLKVHSRHSFF